MTEKKAKNRRKPAIIEEFRIGTAAYFVSALSTLIAFFPIAFMIQYYGDVKEVGPTGLSPTDIAAYGSVFGALIWWGVSIVMIRATHWTIAVARFSDGSTRIFRRYYFLFFKVRTKSQRCRSIAVDYVGNQYFLTYVCKLPNGGERECIHKTGSEKRHQRFRQRLEDMTGLPVVR